MKNATKMKFIVAVLFAIAVSFGIGANLGVEAQASNNRNARRWVNNAAMFINQDWNSRNELQRRFPQSRSYFTSQFVTLRNWAMFNVTGYDYLEIHIMNGNVVFAINEDDMEDIGGNHSIIETNRAFLASNQIWVHGYIPNRNIVYVVDHPERSNQDSTLIISVPKSDTWLFDNVNITVENGQIEIAHSIMDFLAESLTINGYIVNTNEDEIVRFGPDTEPVPRNFGFQLTPSPQPTDNQTDNLIGLWKSVENSSITIEFNQDGTVVSRFPFARGIEGTWYVTGELLTISKTVTVFGVTSSGTGTGRFEVTAESLRIHNQDRTYQDWVRVR